MKLEIADKKALLKPALAGAALVIVAVLTLEGTAILQYMFSQKGLKEEASLRAESQLEATRIQIMDVIDQAETAVRNTVWLAQWCLDVPDSLHRVAERLVEDNPVIVGSTVAMVPGYNRRLPLYAPYAMREADGAVILKNLATQEYDYPSQEWFTKPVETGQGYWSEPYIDEGGGEILMTTYSVPIRDKKGNIAAVLTADLSLDWLTELVGNVKVYPNAFSIMLSRTGQFMVCPAETLVMHRTINEFVGGLEGNNRDIDSLAKAMMSGKEGNMPIRYKGATSYIYFSPVERTGWSMSIVIPDTEIYGGVRRIGLWVKILQILGILLIILIIYSVFKSSLKYRAMNASREKMESELQIASAIQMAMIPKIFPPFPERKDLDMAAAIVPAKEVGGDLYDFYIRDEKLIFCIGDVSGKGVPASLVMAVTRSLFRSFSAHDFGPAHIVQTMNESMSADNANNMFVTFFCGVLDLKNGHLRYCNAGHNAPFMLTDRISELPVQANIPLGVLPGFEFQEQEFDMASDDAIFLYTDGLNEAENIDHELFGTDRVKAVLRTRRGSMEQLNAVNEAVREFVGDAPQSDDLTMLFIHYTSPAVPSPEKRSLVLDNVIAEISKLAPFVDSIADEKGLDPSLAMSLNLALEEAASNVIMYAYPEGTNGPVYLDAVVGNDSLTFILSDRGKPFDPTAKPDADITLGVEERGIGGLGILMVKNIMDSVTYARSEDGMNILTMIKNI